MTAKKSRSERDYGLPRLTIAEAMRVLGATEAEFMAFVYSLRPSPGRFSRWVNDEEPLPEVLVRLYRHRQLETQQRPPEEVAVAPPPLVEERPPRRGQSRALSHGGREGGARR